MWCSLKETWFYAPALGKACIVAVFLAILSGGGLAFIRGGMVWLAAFVAAVCLMELLLRGVVWVLNGQGNSIVRDELPRITQDLVARFYDSGFDPELGWIRKPGTGKLDLGLYPYSIDGRGSRHNPGHEHLPSLIGSYGDSYTFCREVDDKGTWQWFLGEKLGCNVLNFGVGNYGFDQALLRLRREFPKNPTPITIFGIVPEGIARNLSVWKHYNEFGNILAFKPRFEIEDGCLRLIPNCIDSKQKYFELQSYLSEIQRNDYFYYRRFKREALRPPYLISFVVRFRNFLLAGCKALRRLTGRTGRISNILDSLIFGWLDTGEVLQTQSLFSDAYATDLLKRLVDDYVSFARESNTFPILLIMPMRDDLWFIRNRGHFYDGFVETIKDRVLVIDMAPVFLKEKTQDDLFCIWHYSQRANSLVAEVITEHVRPYLTAILGRRRL